MENGENSPAVVTEEKAIETEEADSEAQVEVKEETPTKVSLKKRRKKNNDSIKEPVTPSSERPSRERKSIERFSNTIEKEKIKELKIEKVCVCPYFCGVLIYSCHDFEVKK